MLFKVKYHAGLADGSITLAFRYWQRPSVKAGGRLRTPVGELSIRNVVTTTESKISEADARRAGYETRAALLADLQQSRRPAADRSDALYRIEFVYAGADSRIELREQGALGEAELADLVRRLDRLDRASTHGAWTRKVLGLVAEFPRLRAADLAVKAGYEKEALKFDVRKLKNLGLTESLGTGYQLSPRGRAFLSGEANS